jgi:ketosteroid isomerase-like protein
MAGATGNERAMTPDDLFRLFVARANAGDLDGLVDLYESDAGAKFMPGQMLSGRDAIRQALQQVLADRPTFSTDGQRPSTVVGDLALTSARLGPDTVTAEVARRQPDGSWRWVIDVPTFLA